jgi:ABC-2 type transport system ATP-binding protein
MLAAETSQLRKKRSGKWVLDGVDLLLPQGESCIICGEKGAGKSALMLTLAGMVYPDEGSAKVFGFPTSERPNLRNLVGFVPQQASFYPHMSVQGLLYYAAKLHRVPKGEVPEYIADLCDCLELAPTVRISRLAVNEVKKLAFAAAIIYSPKLILIDGIEDGFEQEDLQTVFAMLKNEKSYGATVLMTACNAQKAASCGTTAFLMQEGKIVSSLSQQWLQNWSYTLVTVPTESYESVQRIEGMRLYHRALSLSSFLFCGEAAQARRLLAQCGLADFHMRPAEQQEVFAVLGGSVAE